MWRNIVFVLFLALSVSMASATAGAPFFEPVNPPRAVQVMAHRVQLEEPTAARKAVLVGFHRGAKRYAPENTMAAFEKAVALGADYIEFDVRTTKDGAYYVLHDATLDRTTDGTGAIADATADTVAALDAGSWFGAPFKGARVPSLDQVLDLLARGEAQAYVDAKAIAPEALAAKLQRYNLAARSVVYQSPGYLRQLRAINPQIRGLCPLGRQEDVARLAETVHPYAFDADWDILSGELILRCHQLGVKVFSDAMGGHENIEDFTQAIEWGIDVIQTDHPLLVFDAIELVTARGANGR